MDSSDVPVVFDGHNDVLDRLGRWDGDGPDAFLEGGSGGHLDLPRAREGGFAGGLFSVWIPNPSEQADAPTPRGLAPPLDPGDALRRSLAAVALLFRIEDRADGALRVVRTAAALRECLECGVLAAVLHLEGADALDTGLDALQVLHRAGLRSLGLVWGRPNAFAEGVPAQFRRSPDTGPGLTTAGRDLVRACNDLRIMIDVSHLNERGFWDVAALSDAPLVATHSNAHAICASTRNLTDRQLDAIADTDGMVGLNFGVHFLREDGARDPDTPLDVMVRQVDHLVDRLGIDRVGFGSDFDGTLVSDHIGDASGLPRLLTSLAQRGYGRQALRKLAHGNWLRVLERTWGA